MTHTIQLAVEFEESVRREGDGEYEWGALHRVTKLQHDFLVRFSSLETYASTSSEFECTWIIQSNQLASSTVFSGCLSITILKVRRLASWVSALMETFFFQFRFYWLKNSFNYSIRRRKRIVWMWDDENNQNEISSSGDRATDNIHDESRVEWAKWNFDLNLPQKRSLSVNERMMK